MTGHVARAAVAVHASAERVWEVLTAPGSRPEIMFGAETLTDWQVGSPVVWRGEWQGAPFEDHGRVLAVEPGRRLVVTHYSPLSGAPDVPENHHTLEYTIEEPEDEDDEGVILRLEQDNNPTAEAAEHSRQQWEQMLEGIKDVAER